MGLDLYCIDKQWGTSYSGFMEFRVTMIKATIKYLETIKIKQQTIKSFIPKSEPTIIKFNPIANNDEFTNFPSHFDIESHEKGFEDSYNIDGLENELHKLIEILHKSIEKRNTPIFGEEEVIMLSEFKQVNHHYVYFFGIHGLLNLINHSDCEGFWSHGDASNILNLLERIYVYIDDMEQYKTWYDDFISLIEESINRNHYIQFS